MFAKTQELIDIFEKHGYRVEKYDGFIDFHNETEFIRYCTLFNELTDKNALKPYPLVVYKSTLPLIDEYLLKKHRLYKINKLMGK